MKYQLSNRQRKELTERARRLRIAMPLPDDWQEGGDLLAYVRSVLDVRPEWILSAEVVEVPVLAPMVGERTDLTSVIGAVVHGTGPPGERLVYRVVAVVCDLQAADHARHDGRTQWPSSVEIDGELWP